MKERGQESGGSILAAILGNTTAENADGGPLELLYASVRNSIATTLHNGSGNAASALLLPGVIRGSGLPPPPPPEQNHQQCTDAISTFLSCTANRSTIISGTMMLY
ncbi:acyltransferase (predicted) [Anopheles sinensis]|uniref:Acyltransferase (Predicted) n=1 Tax=Anopheles sinensis TaxID=74873 RepID=A0A084W8Y8_ANOSI|nr:acyltransferase (predicted) [Anopheles sinensis]